MMNFAIFGVFFELLVFVSFAFPFAFDIYFSHVHFFVFCDGSRLFLKVFLDQFSLLMHFWILVIFLNSLFFLCVSLYV